MKIKSPIILFLALSICLLIPKNCFAEVEYIPLIGSTSVREIITRYNQILRKFLPMAYDLYRAGNEVVGGNEGEITTSYALLGNDEQNVQFFIFTVENKQITSAALFFSPDSHVHQQKIAPDVLFYLLSACDFYGPNDNSRNLFIRNTAPLEIENFKEKSIVVKGESASSSCIIHKTFNKDDNLFWYMVVHFMEPAKVEPRDNITENNLPSRSRRRTSIDGHYDFEGMGSPSEQARRSNANMSRR